MILDWFEIENFRSIVDKTRCDLENDITILAGKNESGKSTILHALNTFESGKFKETDYPEGTDGVPKITLQYLIDRDEMESFVREIFEWDDDDELDIENKPYTVTITRVAGKTFTLGGEALDKLTRLRDDEISHWQKQIDEVMKEIKKADVLIKHKQEIQQIKNNDIPAWLEFLADFVNTFAEVPDVETVEAYHSQLKEYKDSLDFYKKDFEFPNKLWKFTPKFVLFDSFTDMLPDQADQDDVKKKVILQRFFSIVGVDSASIFNEESTKKRRAIVDRISSDMSGDFCGYYKQSDIEIKLGADGDMVQFYVYDGLNTPFFPEQRSKGFQWFLSFYLTLKSTGIDSNNIILIDEPGLYLHPTAQKEILQILEHLSIDHQVLFSTHSPYLISPENLNRVRLVMKPEEIGSTYIENKIQKVADKDTLAPIINAIGYDFSQGLSLGRELSIVTEGISDWYYLMAFVRLLASDMVERISIIPSVGADQVPNIISILLGWGMPCVAVFDNDNQGRAAYEKLVKNFGFVDGWNAILVSSKRNHSMEDLISVGDFYQFVLREDIPENVPGQRNSALAGQRKVTLAKTFYDFVSENSIQLSAETVENICALLKTLGIIELSEATA